MAHAYTVAVPVVLPQPQDAALARRAAALLIRLQPNKSPGDVALDLLGEMREEKITREARGLNHWDEHAPQFLAGLVRQARRDRDRRYREAEAFLRRKRHQALRAALAIVGNEAAAEVVVAETFRELLVGSATVPGFFTALVGNARNYLEAQANFRDKHGSLDDAVDLPADSDAQGFEDETASFDPPSHRLEDQDPLDILIARETEVRREKWEQIERKDELEYALSVVRYPGNRHILKKKWWRESEIGDLEKKRHEAVVTSLRAQRKRFRPDLADRSAKSPDM